MFLARISLEAFIDITTSKLRITRKVESGMDHFRLKSERTSWTHGHVRILRWAQTGPVWRVLGSRERGWHGALGARPRGSAHVLQRQCKAAEQEQWPACGQRRPRPLPALTRDETNSWKTRDDNLNLTCRLSPCPGSGLKRQRNEVRYVKYLTVPAMKAIFS